MIERSLKNKTVLITGADGGIGTALIKELIKRDVLNIYATGISEERINALAAQYPQKVKPILLDVTKKESVLSVSKTCIDTDIIINNAGVELKTDFIGDDTADKALIEMQVNYIGIINMINYFLPILHKKERSYILNVLSIGSTFVVKNISTYCASKTAAHILTQSLRPDLEKNNVELIGIYPGYVDTSMCSDVDVEKITPDSLAVNICNYFEAGVMDIFPDKMSKDLYSKHPINITYLN